MASSEKTDEDILTSATRVGAMDRGMSGWTNEDTRELVPGVVIKPGMNVVDVGCGDGSYITFCSNRGADVTFVDVQEDKVKALEHRLGSNPKGKVTGVVSDCNPIPLPSGCADVVISTEVLEHVRDPKAFMTELVRLGNKDALYVLTVPDKRGEMMIKNIAPPVYFEEPNHIHMFSAEDFEELASSCGLQVERHELLSGFWSIFYLLKWSTAKEGQRLTDNCHPATYHWTLAWEAMLNHPHSERARQALNEAVPRAQLIVARRKS